MLRPDLLALTEAGLTQMANAGLVKRALRDLAAGQGPVLAETGDGAIEARFADGTLTRLPAGRPLDQATCSCPASGLCRHRVTLALAWQRHAAETAPADAPSFIPDQAWDPVTLDGAAFEATLAADARADLTRLLAVPLSVRLERGAIPAAHLPMATVRFLTPSDLGYARCDCARVTGCAHIALALRAYAAADGANEAILGARASAPAGDDPASALIMAVDAVVARLLAEGVVAGMAAHARGLDHARRVARDRGATWLLLAFDALIEQIEAYEARGARHDEVTVLSLVAELFARTRAADADAALGRSEPLETPMARTRLVSLGVRITARGAEMTARALLADTDTGATMLLERHFATVDGVPPSPETVVESAFAPGLPVRGVAYGQILTSVARRRADGMVALGAGGRGKTTLMPRVATPPLPSPPRVENLDALIAAYDGRPPMLIRPRNRVADMRVFDIASVLGQAWEPGAQLWRAAVTLPDEGGTLYLERSHDSGAPGAMEALFAVAAGRHGQITRIAGAVSVRSGAVVCEPWSLMAERLIVPDLETAASSTDILTRALRPERPSAPETARLSLAEAAHAGRRARDAAFNARARAAAAALRDAGFQEGARRMEAWLGAGPDEAVPFGRAALWLATLSEG